MTGIHGSMTMMHHESESLDDTFEFDTLRISVYESGAVVDRIGVAFGTYVSSERLIVTIEDLLSSEFCLNDLCVVGPHRSLSDSLKLLQEQPRENLSQLPLFTRTEPFFGDDDIDSGVGSTGRSLDILKGLMERRRICSDESRVHEYNINCLELKKQIGAGNPTLFICTNALDPLVLALRILIRRSSFKVQSHEFRQ